MLIDDEVLILNGLTKLIDWEGLNLRIKHTALNGEEALDIFRHSPADIIITDITMPKMSGLQLIKEIKKFNNDARFIILSGYDDFSYAKQAISLGIDNYILKPINEQELEATLENIVEKLKKSESTPIIEGKKLEMIRENILYRWMQNAISFYELEERNEILDIDLRKDYYCIGVIKLDIEQDHSRNFSDLYDEIRKYVKDSVRTIEVFNDLDSNIVCIYCGNVFENIKDEFRRLLSGIVESIKEKYKINIFVAIGSIESSYKNASKSYDNAKILMDYSLIVGYNRIVDYSSADQKNMGILLEKLIDSEKLGKALLSKDIDTAFRYIDEVFDKIYSLKNIKPEDIQNAALKFLLEFNDISNELGISLSSEDENIKKIIMGIFKIGKASELKSIIKEKCKFIIEKMKSNQEVRSPIIQRILAYVNENYYEEISLKTLGVRFHINPSYLGQIFYKEVGEQFSDYINRVKNEHAKTMLLTTNLKINEIAQRVGYSDNSYFYKKFKEIYGVSPNVLRNTKSYN